MNILKLTAILDGNVTAIGNATAYVIKWTYSSVYVEIYIDTKWIGETRVVSCNFSWRKFSRKFVAKPTVLPCEIENNSYAFV